MKILSYNKSLFLALIAELNRSSIKYAIVGDYQNLPESIGHDIDFWTDNPVMFLNLIKQVVKEQGFKVLSLNKQTLGTFNISI